MAVSTTRTLPAQFIEDLGRDYGKQISALTSLPVDTTKFAPQVAAQDPYQAAALGYLDDVIKPRDSRKVLVKALGALLDKEETRPERKHGNIPL